MTPPFDPSFYPLATYSILAYYAIRHRNTITAWIFHRLNVCQCRDGWRHCSKEWLR